MSPKELVKSFYESDLANDLSLIDIFYHKDCKLYWNSSKGFRERDFNDIYTFFKSITQSYNNLRFQLSHLLEEGNNVTTRYTLYAKTIESSDEEIPLAHYISITEVKDNKFYRVYEMSQPADRATLESISFSEIKV
jgi:succinate dehydrogenase flavin-adding protein (antitoxin of CptAB toxin-antitoxin module)